MFGLYPNAYLTLISIFESFEKIESVMIYGSRAKGNYKEGSDVDLTIFGDLTYNDLQKVNSKIEESDIPYKVDLSLYHNLASETLVDHIRRVGKVFYTAK